MIDRILIKNFRGIRKAEVDLAPITILTGPNNAGKSSVMYALVALKNIVSNPNQPIDSFFNLGFLNIGGFKQGVFSRDETLGIYLGVEGRDSAKDYVGGCGIGLQKHGGAIHLAIKKPFSLTLDLDVTFPYALNLNASGVVEHEGNSFQITWNGLAPTVAPAPLTITTPPIAGTGGQADLGAKDVAALISVPFEDVRRVDMVPLRRGFTKPVYSASPITPQLLSEEEIATILATDSDLLGRVDHALEFILNRNLVIFTPPSTASSFLQTRNRETGATQELVNEGFGTNQLVFMLAKILKDGTDLVCMEEPEIHLHPSAILKFVEQLARIVKEPLESRRRHFIVSTHSEHVITALLGLVAKRELNPNDIALYYLERQQYETVLEHCEVTEQGQVSGGLRGFYDAELSASRALLGSPVVSDRPE